MSLPPVSVDLSDESLLAANVNPATKLATDYLNLFNEALMLINLVGDSPELLEELADWQPCSYEVHFRASPFHFKDVVVSECWFHSLALFHEHWFCDPENWQPPNTDDDNAHPDTAKTTTSWSGKWPVWLFAFNRIDAWPFLRGERFDGILVPRR